MTIAKRILLFIVVNAFITLTISLLLQLFQVQPYLTAQGLDFGNLAAFAAIWGFGGAFISLQLSRVMAKWMMGVKVIDPNQATLSEATLLNMVHRLAADAQLPKMPQVGIYNSPEVNAFATGPSKSRSLVAVSSGLLNTMGADALEGVLAHEISHVANGDMVTMTLLQGVINAFVIFLSRVIGFFLTRSEDRDRNVMTRSLVTFACELVLTFMGMMVVAAFSRWREYRADAGGAHLVGSHKMISALQTLQGVSSSRYQQPAEATAYEAFKISARPAGLFALFATHPPLTDRIQRLRDSLS